MSANPDAGEFGPERPFCAWIGGTCDNKHGCCDDPDSLDNGDDDDLEGWLGDRP